MLSKCIAHRKAHPFIDRDLPGLRACHDRVAEFWRYSHVDPDAIVHGQQRLLALPRSDVALRSLLARSISLLMSRPLRALALVSRRVGFQVSGFALGIVAFPCRVVS